jgi:hypothetical protein
VKELISLVADLDLSKDTTESVIRTDGIWVELWLEKADELGMYT